MCIRDSYGETTQKIFLLTCDMYRKYRSVIPNLDDGWWLATAYSTCLLYTSYHLVRIIGGGATVDGWVDKGTFTKA